MTRGIGKHPEERKISNRNAEANREIMLTGPRLVTTARRNIINRIYLEHHQLRSVERHGYLCQLKAHMMNLNVT